MFTADSPPFELDGVSWWGSVTSSGPSDALLNRECLIVESDANRMVLCDGVKYMNVVEPSGDLSSPYPYVDQTHQLYNISDDEIENINLINISSYNSTLVHLQSILKSHDENTDHVECDPCGGSATYYETITVFNSTEKRTISTTGCPVNFIVIICDMTSNCLLCLFV